MGIGYAYGGKSYCSFKLLM